MPGICFKQQANNTKEGVGGIFQRSKMPKAKSCAHNVYTTEVKEPANLSLWSRVPAPCPLMIFRNSICSLSSICAKIKILHFKSQTVLLAGPYMCFLVVMLCVQTQFTHLYAYARWQIRRIDSY